MELVEMQVNLVVQTNKKTMGKQTEAKAAAAIEKRGRSKQKITEMLDGVEVTGVVKGGFTPRKAWEMQKYKTSDGKRVKMKRLSDDSGSYEIVKRKDKEGSFYSGSYQPNPKYGNEPGRTVIEKKKGRKAKITTYGSDR